MIQVQTELFVADNTGTKKIECIRYLEAQKKMYDEWYNCCGESYSKEVKKGSVHKAVVYAIKEFTGTMDQSRFDNNAAVFWW